MGDRDPRSGALRANPTPNPSPRRGGESDTLRSSHLSSPPRRGEGPGVGFPGRPRPPRVTVLYHFMAPDDVVSARVFSDLAEGLAARGWQVDARPCNRAWDDRKGSFPRRETRDGVAYRRVFRPPLPQARAPGRLLNAAWMIGAWSAIALGPDPPD